MGFFKELKEDFSKAVSELIPEKDIFEDYLKAESDEEEEENPEQLEYEGKLPDNEAKNIQDALEQEVLKAIEALDTQTFGTDFLQNADIDKEEKPEAEMIEKIEPEAAQAEEEAEEWEIIPEEPEAAQAEEEPEEWEIIPEEPEAAQAEEEPEEWEIIPEEPEAAQAGEEPEEWEIIPEEPEAAQAEEEAEEWKIIPEEPEAAQAEEEPEEWEIIPEEPEAAQAEEEPEEWEIIPEEPEAAQAGEEPEEWEIVPEESEEEPEEWEIIPEEPEAAQAEEEPEEWEIIPEAAQAEEEPEEFESVPEDAAVSEEWEEPDKVFLEPEEESARSDMDAFIHEEMNMEHDLEPADLFEIASSEEQGADLFINDTLLQNNIEKTEEEEMAKLEENTAIAGEDNSDMELIAQLLGEEGAEGDIEADADILAAADESIEEEPVENVEQALENAQEAEDIESRTPREEVTVITKGTKICGNISSDGSLDIMGTIEGDIDCLGKLSILGTVKGNSKASEIDVNTAKLTGNLDCSGNITIGVGTIVVGNLKSSSAMIAGAIKGELDVEGPVVIDSTAIVKGNINAKSVQINNGAVVDGYCSLSYAEVDIDNFFDADGEK